MILYLKNVSKIKLVNEYFNKLILFVARVIAKLINDNLKNCNLVIDNKKIIY